MEMVRNFPRFETDEVGTCALPSKGRVIGIQMENISLGGARFRCLRTRGGIAKGEVVKLRIRLPLLKKSREVVGVVVWVMDDVVGIKFSTAKELMPHSQAACRALVTSFGKANVARASVAALSAQGVQLLRTCSAPTCDDFKKGELVMVTIVLSEVGKTHCLSAVITEVSASELYLKFVSWEAHKKNILGKVQN